MPWITARLLSLDAISAKKSLKIGEISDRIVEINTASEYVLVPHFSS